MRKQQTIYLSGAINGEENHNIPAFNYYKHKWKKAGYDVISPVESFNGRTDLPRETYMRKDIADILDCDGLALLPGWDQSRGAVLEACIAKQIGLPVYDADSMAECLVTVVTWAGLVDKETYEDGLAAVDCDFRQDAGREDDTGPEDTGRY